MQVAEDPDENLLDQILCPLTSADAPVHEVEHRVLAGTDGSPDRWGPPGGTPHPGLPVVEPGRPPAPGGGRRLEGRRDAASPGGAAGVRDSRRSLPDTV